MLTQLTPTFYMKVGWIDDTSNRMREVEIYDLQNTQERKSVYADSGTFTLSPDSVDLQLVLYDGEQLQFPEGDAAQAAAHLLPRAGAEGEGPRRAASTPPNRKARTRASASRGSASCRRSTCCAPRSTSYAASGGSRSCAPRRWRRRPPTPCCVVPRPRPAHGGLAKLYCETIPGWFTPKMAEAAPAPVVAASVVGASVATSLAFAVRAPQDSAMLDSMRREFLRQDSIRRANAPPIAPALQPTDSAGGAGGAGAALPLPGTGPDGVTMQELGPDGQPIAQPPVTKDDSIAAMRALREAELEANRPPPAIFTVTPESLTDALMQMSKYAVEVQKKFALSIACFVFVLFGPPIALRFPRGGVGVTIGVSLVVFGAYYVCLMAGETLADKGRLDPVIAMWGANVIFLVAGLLMLWRVEKTADASRGGGVREWLANRRARRAIARAPGGAQA